MVLYTWTKDVGIDDIYRCAAAAETHADSRHVGGVDFISKVRGPWRHNLRHKAVGAGSTAIACPAGSAHRPVAGKDHRAHRQIRGTTTLPTTMSSITVGDERRVQEAQDEVVPSAIKTIKSVSNFLSDIRYPLLFAVPDPPNTARRSTSQSRVWRSHR